MRSGANRSNYFSENPDCYYMQYSVKFQKVDKAFLTPSDLALVEGTQQPVHQLDLARDLFVFSCNELVQTIFVCLSIVSNVVMEWLQISLLLNGTR